MDISTLLGSAVIAGIVAGIVSIRISERNIAIENITKQRQLWRDKIRKIAIDISSAYAEPEKKKIQSHYIELQLLLNPNDDDDKSILDTVWAMINETGSSKLDIELAEKLSLLLKHDWERAKFEAKPYHFKVLSITRKSYNNYNKKRITNS
jgi:mannose/fructose/N-acetylgalactosamine-specific phosphotransferase system component IID